MPNNALIRRRSRDVDLKFEIYSIGSSSRSDISVVYMKDRVNQKAFSIIQ